MTYVLQAIVGVLGLAALGQLVGLVLRLMIRPRREP